MMSVVFYKERIIFLDAAFAVFHIVKDGDLAIQIFRFGDGLARLFPLAAYGLRQPLHIIALLYSIGSVLVYLIPYIICGTVLKQYRLALVILLANILFVSHSFYWPTAQVPQAIAYLMLLLSILWDKDLHRPNIALFAVTVALMITIVFFHPLMALCFFYAMVFFLIRNMTGINRRTLYTLCILFVTVFLIKNIFFRAEYEKHSLSGLKNFIKLFPNYFDTYTNRRFLAAIITKYYWIAIICAIVSVLYLKNRSYKNLIFFLGTTLGYITLVNTSYPTAETPAFYLEVLYLPLGLFLALPIIFDVLPAIKERYAITLMVAIMITGCYRIYATHIPYTERLEMEREFLKKHGHTKMIAGSQKMDISSLQMLWGTPYEFWLLSTIENGYSASIIIDDTPSQRAWAAEKNKELIVNWNHFSYQELDTRYFRFNDTISGYKIDPDL
ncbi:hypothetical protein GCM10023093_05020 [Nemorincola caseinilytica]|uniref:Glycosyltransferase RgtA/B/C/D-like domain-containing protein n=1 Tax=Nemorincola caseinilytica TaxID=2054315 RepID=A0ABP8N4A1_9BACT